ncbi:hypothetical protein BU054_06915 [Staphylococcus simulans]|uniref:hypothetical protein n=1 Tax=Staphylococcus simulans TaxID=1286 RepID=UPI000D1E01F4|nr:hypothetical protein [Staphylococcus simulans]PTI97371.1 hypothetical protein BU054_06915 [Staphylococcus simulans]
MKRNEDVMNEYLEKFLDGYRNVVNKRYIYQFQSNPEAFPFIKDNDYKISIVLLNKEFFEYPKVIIISNDSDMKEIYDYTTEDESYLSENYVSYIFDPISYVRNCLNLINIEEHTFFMSIYHGEYPPSKILSYKLDGFYSEGKNFAEKHFRKFAVAIESFLIKLKRVNNIKHKDSDPTMYDRLLESLKANKKINYRTKKRIEVAYNMRNIVNHSQAGAVAKADCDFLLNTLKDIVDANEKVLLEHNQLINDSK